MKTLILLLGVAFAFPLATTRAESSSGRTAAWPSASVTIQQDYPGKPRLDYSKVPWVKPPVANDAPKPEALVQNAQDKLDAAISAVNAVSQSLTNRASALADNVVALAAQEFNNLPSKDLSARLSQNFSVNLGQNLSVNCGQNLSANCGQLLSTSLATPTAPPWSSWGNGPRAVVAGTPSGEIVLPAFPPRTAWGNGPGVVITTPGGAIYSMVPAAAQKLTDERLVDASSLRELNSQLQVVQTDLEQLRAILKNEAAPPQSPENHPETPPAYQPYLPPTGR